MGIVTFTCPTISHLQKLELSFGCEFIYLFRRIISEQICPPISYNTSQGFGVLGFWGSRVPSGVPPVGCKAIIHQHLDQTLTLMIAGHRVGHYSAEGKLLTPLTKKQIKAVEKTLRGKVQKQTFPLNLQIPQTTRDSHFSTASTATNL